MKIFIEFMACFIISLGFASFLLIFVETLSEPVKAYLNKRKEIKQPEQPEPPRFEDVEVDLQEVTVVVALTNDRVFEKVFKGHAYGDLVNQVETGYMMARDYISNLGHNRQSPINDGEYYWLDTAVSHVKITKIKPLVITLKRLVK